jgi:hypothetical protein
MMVRSRRSIILGLVEVWFLFVCDSSLEMVIQI